jgi:hypothetical protein
MSSRIAVRPRVSASACLSQKRMSISRYIIAAVVSLLAGLLPLVGAQKQG